MNGNQSWRSSMAGRRRLERDLFDFPLATSCFIGQPLALGTDERAIGAGLVVYAELDAVVVPEIELGQISGNVLYFNVLINTYQAAFEDRKEALKRVGMHVAAHPFLFGMVNARMLAGHVAIADRAIGVEAAIQVEVPP